jgi:hypothetical protein
VAGSLNGDSKLKCWIWVGVFKGSALLMWLQSKRCIWKVAMKGDNRRKRGGSGPSSASPELAFRNEGRRIGGTAAG